MQLSRTRPEGPEISRDLALLPAVLLAVQMLAACSNPSRVMQQQLAFDEQDTQAAARAACRQLAGRGGGSSRGLMSGKGHRAAARKPRKGWMALF